ncbi:hypothetical protein E2562_018302 [Oryza meyeriana var. granulata]|uniref:Metallo-beta-lactamase domain-containing protein n=1 Tax=Oryza meyeriana var. granulata TaxID=110450 RepID=A0A6G1CS36_9ORYZ|nr:hypothetical protein E2562_018302 [Oryza meyeriana var. granulata]
MEPPAAAPAGDAASSLIFLGTGCSGALPDARCLIHSSTPPCPVCSQALSLPPERNPNYSVAARFSYLMKNKLEEGDEVSQVAQLDWTIIEGDIDKPFVSSGLEFVPLPVMHGEDYVCSGFLFGRKTRIAYLSDVSRILPRTEHAISKSGAGQLDLLVLETNRLHGEGDARSCHLTLSQTLNAIKRISPKRALLIGMNHEFEHQKENQTLAEWSSREGIPVQLAHDGLCVFIDL